MTRCTYDPRPLLGQPIGMLHCPECGCMVLAGLEHGPCEPECTKFDELDRAIWDRMHEQMKEDEEKKR